MHWNNGRFHGPVTLENSLKITDYKYNALNYDNNSINFGDHNIFTNINGNKINIQAGNSGMILNSAKDVYIESDTSIYTVAGTVSNFSSNDNMTIQSNKGHLLISALGSNGSGNNRGLISLNGKYGVSIGSDNGDININTKSFTVAKGTETLLDLQSKSDTAASYTDILSERTTIRSKHINIGEYNYTTEIYLPATMSIDIGNKNLANRTKNIDIVGDIVKTDGNTVLIEARDNINIDGSIMKIGNYNYSMNDTSYINNSTDDISISANNGITMSGGTKINHKLILGKEYVDPNDNTKKQPIYGTYDPEKTSVQEGQIYFKIIS